ncbi:MAG: hypothetical protein R2939_21135 [Kofleriaceae bacterium]
MVVGALATWASEATAGRLLIPAVYAEADLADEAGAATLLLRGALDSETRPVIPAVEMAAYKQPITLGTAQQSLKTFGADRVVWGHLDRIGSTLVMRASVIDETGAITQSVSATAPDGDVRDLIEEIAEDAASALGMPKPTVADASLGQLRPFVLAARLSLAGQWAAAASVLEAGDPVVAARIAPARSAARQVWSRADLPLPARLTAVVAGGTPRDDPRRRR